MQCNAMPESGQDKMIRLIVTMFVRVERVWMNQVCQTKPVDKHQFPITFSSKFSTFTSINIWLFCITCILFFRGPAQHDKFPTPFFASVLPFCPTVNWSVRRRLYSDVNCLFFSHIFSCMQQVVQVLGKSADLLDLPLIVFTSALSARKGWLWQFLATRWLMSGRERSW